MNSSARIVVTLALLLAAGGAFIACGGDEADTDENTGAAGGGGELKIQYSPMYSAFEPSHTYQLPAIVEGIPGDQVEWAASPADAVSFTPSPEGTTITMKKAGDVTITAKAGGKSGTAKLSIQAATPELHKLGEMRYMVMNAPVVPTDGGIFPIGLNPNAPCTTCHGETAALEVQHTPTQTGGYSSEELIKIFTEATKPAGFKQRTNVDERIWKSIHKWQMDEESKQGIVVYLRSLPPKVTNAELDFGGALRGLIGDAGLRFPGFGDGGFRFPEGGFRLGDAGFNFGGFGRSDAGTAATMPQATNVDAGM